MLTEITTIMTRTDGSTFVDHTNLNLDTLQIEAFPSTYEIEYGKEGESIWKIFIVGSLLGFPFMDEVDKQDGKVLDGFWDRHTIAKKQEISVDIVFNKGYGYKYARGILHVPSMEIQVDIPDEVDNASISIELEKTTVAINAIIKGDNKGLILDKEDLNLIWLHPYLRGVVS